MALYDDILLTVDYDRTLTGPDSVVPQRNWDAIAYFVENGGTFTMNTGRSTTTMRDLLYTLPNNAPLLLYNDSAAWDGEKLIDLKIIDLPMWEVLDAVGQAFPEMNLEIQAVDNHYLLDAPEEFIQLYKKMRWSYAPAQQGADLGPFLKFAIYGPIHNPALSDMYNITDEEEARTQELVDFLKTHWGDKIEIFRAAPRIVDVHAKGVSKGNAALDLKKKLGKKYQSGGVFILVRGADNNKVYSIVDSNAC